MAEHPTTMRWKVLGEKGPVALCEGTVIVPEAGMGRLERLVIEGVDANPLDAGTLKAIAESAEEAVSRATAVHAYRRAMGLQASDPVHFEVTDEMLESGFSPLTPFEIEVRRQRRMRRPDSDFRKVASIYKKAYRLGYNVQDAVAREMFVSRARAGILISEARKRGFLPKTKKGKAKA